MENEDRPMSFGPQILINPDKKNFVISARLAGIPTITAAYNIVNGEHQANLMLDNNRWDRVDNLLKSAPEMITLRSDGKSLAIDATSRLITIDTGGASANGILQYRVDDGLKPVILANFVAKTFEPIYLAVDEDESERTNELFVYPVSGYGGFIVGITDGAERILHLSIDRNGLVAASERHEYKRLMAIMRQWSMIGLNAVITGNKLVIECKALREHLPFQRGVVTIHDNYKGELTIAPMYELVE